MLESPTKLTVFIQKKRKEKKFDCQRKKNIENKKKTKNWLWESIKKSYKNVRGTGNC